MEFISDNANKGKMLKKDDRIMFYRYLDDYFKDMYNYNDNEIGKQICKLVRVLFVPLF